MTKTASRVVAGDGTPGSLTPEQIVKYGIAQGVIAAKDEAAWKTYAAQHAGDALTAVCSRITARRAVTPATPATAASGASGAGGSGDDATTYPSAWQRAVSAAQRITGSRKAQPVKSAWPTVTPSAQVAGRSTPASGSGFYDKSVKPSAQAAAQEAARQADLQRMAAEQAARGL
jgi:hypothetical protein